MRACSGLGAGGSADRVHVRAEELEEVGDGHVDRDGENAELGRALLREHIVVLEDAHLGCGVVGTESAESAIGASEIKAKGYKLDSACTHMSLEFLNRRIPSIKRDSIAFCSNIFQGFIQY